MWRLNGAGLQQLRRRRSAEAVEHSEGAKCECDGAPERDDNSITRTEKQTRCSDDNDVNGDEGRMSDVGGPNQPGHQENVNCKLDSGLKRKRPGKPASGCVDKRQTEHDEHRQRCGPGPGAIMNPNSSGHEDENGSGKPTED